MNKFRLSRLGASVLALLAGTFMMAGSGNPQGKLLTLHTPFRSGASKVVDSPASGGERLPADIQKRLEGLEPQTRDKLLADPLFRELMITAPEPARAPFFESWLDGLTDNFCRELLHEAASRAFDTDGVKALQLPVAQSGCRRGVGLAQTIDYVNSRLRQAFNDPYTRILAPGPAQDMIEKLSGQEQLQGGVGLVFTMNRSRADDQADPDTGEGQQRFQFNGLIYHVTATGPAAAAGIQDGDWLLKVDGVDVAGLDSEEVIEHMLRGVSGNPVKLTLKRGDTIFERTVTRGVVKPEPVWSRHLGNNIYAIVITRWQENVSSLIYRQLKLVQAAGAKGVIIDLRHNGGGEFMEAVAAASMLVKDGVLVSVRERVALADEKALSFQTSKYEQRDGRLTVFTTDESTGKTEVEEGIVSVYPLSGEKSSGRGGELYLKDMPPFVVLGNEGTASASEVFIGSLIKNKVGKPGVIQGATFIGTPTFGKGIEQANGPAALRMRISVTMGRYYLNDGFWPGDAFHNRHPLTPDIVVEEPEGAMFYTESDEQLQAGVDYLVKRNAQSTAMPPQ